MSKSAKKVICAGRLYGDVILSGFSETPKPGTEVYCDSLSFHPGGGAFITAAYLSWLGLDAQLLAVFPADPFSGPLKKMVEDHNVGTELCGPAPAGSDPQITVALVDNRDRSFLTRRDGPAVPPDFSEKMAQSGAVHLHIGELATLVECPEILQCAQSANMTVSLDCGWDPAVFQPEVAELIAQVDVFLPNETEATALVAAGLSPPFSKTDAIKLGPNGARASWEGGTVERPATVVPVVDPTGAGDAFNGGFLSKWLTGASLAECLTEGNRSGAIAVTFPGGAGGLKNVDDDANSVAVAN